ncbi:amidohydrolase family protein [Adhaeribacter swui]|uniref:Amidohydrolase family protein n=1 Tax=Adhaeribacter swui TaxID=2086471 RepID=A0A7G7GC59_9BACT|nr:amidohydrolase family protein [Adhaeribacter swui]QNF34743.1 amidohydrolase family protein [Adhaeribacter swui]
MKKFILVLALLAGSLTNYAQKSTAGFYLIKAGKMYDAETNTFVTDQEILISGNTIQAVGPRLKVPKNAQILDAHNATVTPGLIDAHTHLLFKQKQNEGLEVGSKIPEAKRLQQGQQFADALLRTGFTTLRDLGNSGQYLDQELQKQLAQDKKPTPRLYLSGPILSPPGGQFFKLPPADSFIIKQEYLIIKNKKDAYQAVTQQAQKKVNVIKVCLDTDYRQMGAEEINAIVAAAKEKKLPVTAHSTSDKTARLAVLAGVNGIEHGYSLSDSTIMLMGQRGVYLVPTDVSREKAMLLVAGIGLKGKEAEDAANNFLQTNHDRIKKARQYKVMLVAGSDFYFDMPNLTRAEGSKDVLVAYLEAGLTPAEVLQTATINAAKAIGNANKTGILKKGMAADLVIFNGDLEKNFTQALNDVQLIIKDGQVVKPENKE